MPRIFHTVFYAALITSAASFCEEYSYAVIDQQLVRLTAHVREIIADLGCEFAAPYRVVCMLNGPTAAATTTTNCHLIIVDPDEFGQMNRFQQYGVLAHELGHIIKAHPVGGMPIRLVSKLVALQSVRGSFCVGDALMRYMGAGKIMEWIFEYPISRSCERSADAHAVFLLERRFGIGGAEYLEALADFFDEHDRALGAMDAQSIRNGWFTHPAPRDRAAYFRAEAQRLRNQGTKALAAHDKECVI